MAKSNDSGTVSVKLDKAVYEIAKTQADKLGISVEQWLTALIWDREP